jgi:tellurite resistance protein TerC
MISLISIDLLAHRGDRADSRRRALIWTALWIGAALLFNVFVAVRFGAEAGEQFLAAYLLEKSLSIDNLFLFLVIFAAFKIPASEQRRVLTWGIIGALVTRGVFIALGAALLHRYHFVVYVFGAILVITALKMLRTPDKDEEPKLLHWLERHLRWTRKLDGHKFLTRIDGRLVATPLMLALIAIELTDVMFAVDSIPAAFAVTSDPFLVYSSNVFAILGLRALYIVLAGALAELRYLRYGLSAVLVFAGAKMLLSSWITVNPLISVGVIVGVIGASVIASLTHASRELREEWSAPPPTVMEH